MGDTKGDAAIATTPAVVLPSFYQSTATASQPHVMPGGTISLTLTARDANGNQETGGGLAVAFALGSGTAAGTFGAVTDNYNGTYTATFTASTAGSNQITATIDGQPVASTPPTLAVMFGAVNGVWAPAAARSVGTYGGNWQGGVPAGAVGDTALLGAAVGTGTATITLRRRPDRKRPDLQPRRGRQLCLGGSGGNSLQFANSGSPASISVTSGAASINAPVVLGDNVNVAAADETSLADSGPISESGGSHG